MLIHAVMIVGALLVMLPVAYLLRVWWMASHPRYPVWPSDGPQTEFRDNDDFLGMGG
jgi:hypothetical protein